METASRLHALAQRPLSPAQVHKENLPPPPDRARLDAHDDRLVATLGNAIDTHT